MENAIERIRDRYLSLSVVEKKIADFVLSHPAQVIYMTTAGLAGELAISEGSIIRFPARLGFKGFSDLKLNIARNLPDQNRMVSEEAAPEDDPHTVLSKLSSELSDAAQMTVASVSNQDLKRAAELILNRKRIEIYGVGSSSMLASDAYYRFMRQGLPAYAVTDAHMASVSASMLDETCLAGVVSYSGRTVETLKAAEPAKKHGAAVIALTSFPNSPLAKLSDVCLVSASRETSSGREAVVFRYSQMLILEALLLYISLKDVGKTLEKMENIAEIIGDHRVHERYSEKMPKRGNDL